MVILVINFGDSTHHVLTMCIFLGMFYMGLLLMYLHEYININRDIPEKPYLCTYILIILCARLFSHYCWSLPWTLCATQLRLLADCPLLPFQGCQRFPLMRLQWDGEYCWHKNRKVSIVTNELYWNYNVMKLNCTILLRIDTMRLHEYLYCIIQCSQWPDSQPR